MQSTAGSESLGPGWKGSVSEIINHYPSFNLKLVCFSLRSWVPFGVSLVLLIFAAKVDY